VTEIEKTRERRSPGEWQKWLFLLLALGLLLSAMIQSTLLNYQTGAIASAWLSIVIYLAGFHVSDRRLHTELVQEMDTLRQELEQFKKAP